MDQNTDRDVYYQNAWYLEKFVDNKWYRLEELNK